MLCGKNISRGHKQQQLLSWHPSSINTSISSSKLLYTCNNSSSSSSDSSSSSSNNNSSSSINNNNRSSSNNRSITLKSDIILVPYISRFLHFSSIYSVVSTSSNNSSNRSCNNNNNNQSIAPTALPDIVDLHLLFINHNNLLLIHPIDHSTTGFILLRRNIFQWLEVVSGGNVQVGPPIRNHLLILLYSINLQNFFANTLFRLLLRKTRLHFSKSVGNACGTFWASWDLIM